jgi:hypothetical protein
LNTITCRELAKILGIRDLSNLKRDIKKEAVRVGSGILSVERETGPTYMNGAVTITMTAEFACRLIKKKRNIPIPAVDFLRRNDSTFSPPSDAGIYFLMLQTITEAIRSLSGVCLTIEREIRITRFSFDFYIPEIDLFIEYNEAGGHHNEYYDRIKKNVLNSTLLTITPEMSYRDAIDVTCKAVSKALELKITNFSHDEGDNI